MGRVAQQHIDQQGRIHLPAHRVGTVPQEPAEPEGLLDLLEEHWAKSIAARWLTTLKVRALAPTPNSRGARAKIRRALAAHGSLAMITSAGPALGRVGTAIT